MIFKTAGRSGKITAGHFDIFFHLLYNECNPLGMYRFRQEILGHKQRVGISSTPLNGEKT